jgi:hypothetical protein
MSNFERISVSEALSRAGFDSIVEVQREALFGRHTGVPVCCECGAMVEPDGQCEHGNPSVLLAKGLI